MFAQQPLIKLTRRQSGGGRKVLGSDRRGVCPISIFCLVYSAGRLSIAKWVESAKSLGVGAIGCDRRCQYASTCCYLLIWTMAYARVICNPSIVMAPKPPFPVHKTSLDQISLSSAWLCSTCGNDGHARQIQPQKRHETQLRRSTDSDTALEADPRKRLTAVQDCRLGLGG